MTDHKDTGSFAARYASFLADLKDHRSLGLALDDETLAKLAKLHDVPVPPRDPVDVKLRADKHALEVLSTETALARARADRERQAGEAAAALALRRAEDARQAALQEEEARQARRVAKIQQQVLTTLYEMTGRRWTYDR